MTYNIGDFVKINDSLKPAIIISKDNTNNSLLVSIHEYNGDYKWVSQNSIEHSNINSEEKLSILANFGDWYYDQHKLLYQELIIENLKI